MDILIPLNDNGSIPLYKQIIQELIALIDRAELEEGKKLPSSRDLANSLGVSRSTVIEAYSELERIGYIEKRSAKGVFVKKAFTKCSLVVSTDSGSVLDESMLSAYGKKVLSSENIDYEDLGLFQKLNYSAPMPELLPLSAWRRVMFDSIREMEKSLNYEVNVLGHDLLIQELASYLKRTRLLDCPESRICIFSSAQTCVDMIGRLVVEEGDWVAVENPGFAGARNAFASYGAEIVGVPVDGSGMNIDYLIALEKRPKLVYVTPGHHDPTGVVLSEKRRRKLIDWANENNVLIIEDDFDGDFRYGERAQPPLKTIDVADNVIYMSSFWKVLYPLVRMGFAVLPEKLIPLVKKAKTLVNRNLFIIEHDALARFLKSGDLEKHIGKTRRTLSNRRKDFVMRINQELGELITIYPVGAGTHLLVAFKTEMAEEDILNAASDAGLPLVSMNSYYCDDTVHDSRFLIPFAHMTEKDMVEAISRFAATIKTALISS